MILSLLAAAALAVPMELQHQGRALDTTGMPFDGTFDLEVLLYDNAVSPAVWSETQSITFDNGYFAATLGADSSNRIPDSLLDGDVLVAVAVDGGTPGPRQDVLSVPFALRANSVSGGVVDATEIQINGNTVIDSSGEVVADIQGATLDGLTCTSDQVPLFDGTTWGCGNTSTAWGDITGIPLDFADDIDNDTLGAVACTDGQGLFWNGTTTAWECYDFVPQLTEAEVETYITNSPIDLAAGSTIGTAAIVTDWSNLPNIPGDIADGDADTQLDEAAVDAFVANNGYYPDTGGLLTGNIQMEKDNPAIDFRDQETDQNGTDFRINVFQDDLLIRDIENNNTLMRFDASSGDIAMTPGGSPGLSVATTGDVTVANDLSAGGHVFGERYFFYAENTSSDQTLDTPNHVVGYSTGDIDPFGVFSPSTELFTAPVDGCYYFSATLSFHNGDGGDDTIEMGWSVDGATPADRIMYINPEFHTSSGDEMSHTNSTVYCLTTGQTVGVMLSNVGGAHQAELRTRNFMGFYLGG